jgi:hypothetical protein
MLQILIGSPDVDETPPDRLDRKRRRSSGYAARSTLLASLQVATPDACTSHKYFSKP